MKEALLHKPGDVETLRSQIYMLATDRNLFRRLQTNSLAGVGELTWEKAAQSLVEAYRKCLNVTE
jgi:glycogen synthase